MSKNLWIAIIVAVVLIFFGWWYMQSQKVQTNPQTTTPSTTTVMESPSPIGEESTNSGSMEKKSEHSVSVTSAGFLPKTLTIKVGETVTWMNDDSANHTVNSAPHPAHTDYSPLNLNVIQPGASKSLSFPMAGTYKYHDHLNPTLFGSITVE